MNYIFNYVFCFQENLFGILDDDEKREVIEDFEKIAGSGEFFNNSKGGIHFQLFDFTKKYRKCSLNFRTFCKSSWHPLYFNTPNIQLYVQSQQRLKILI